MSRNPAVPLAWLLGLGGAVGVLTTSTGPVLARVGAGAADPDAAVAAAAAVLAWLVLAWLALGVAVGLLEALPRSPGRDALFGGLLGALAPDFMRRGVRASLRAGIVVGVAGSAVVTPLVSYASPDAPTAAVRLADQVAPPSWPVLDRPAHPLRLAATSTVRPTGPQHYRVRPGDSLWSIAADHLPHDASSADVARAWPLWWQRNRDVIGDRPELIHPGLTLRVPGATP